jgi:hypothetical protein
MARLFTNQGMSAYIAKERVPYKPEIELRKVVFNIDKEHGYVCNLVHQKGKPSYDKDENKNIVVEEKSIYLYREEDEIYADIFYDNSRGKAQSVNFTHCVKGNQKYQEVLNSIKWPESSNTDIPFDSELVKLVKYCISKWNYFVIRSKQPIPAKVFNHPKEHCELFGCWENEENTNHSFTPFYPQILTEEDNALIAKIVSNALKESDASLKPTESLTDFEKLISFINFSEEKPAWNLVRVSVDSNQSIYSKQIDKCNQLFHKELDALIAEKKITYLGNDMYKLPKVVSCEIDFEKFKDKLIVTPICNFRSIGILVSELWAKKHNLDVSDLKVDNYAHIINDTILDAFYRDELFLHENYTGKNIEYGHNYDNFDHFYWHELRDVLTKKGIRNFPDYQNVENLLKELKDAEIAYEAENDGEKITLSLPQKKKAKWHDAFRWLLPKILMDEYADKPLPVKKSLAKKVLEKIIAPPKFIFNAEKNSEEQRNVIFLCERGNIFCRNYCGDGYSCLLPEKFQKYRNGSNLSGKYTEETVCNEGFKEDVLKLLNENRFELSLLPGPIDDTLIDNAVSHLFTWDEELRSKIPDIEKFSGLRNKISSREKEYKPRQEERKKNKAK